MTVNEFMLTNQLKSIHIEDGEREISGAYCGDLLSWVMGRAEQGNVWITIMTNINILAVASLADIACIVVAENAPIEQAVVNAAKENKINILSSELSEFELCGKIYEMLKSE